MKKVEKRRLNKNMLQLTVLGTALLVLIAVLITVRLLPPRSTPAEEVELPEIDEALGESLYLNVPLVYENIASSNMEYILVHNRDEKGNLRMYGVASLEDGSFVLEYSKDGTVDTLTPYLPSIIGEEGDFDLSSLYAKATGTSYTQVYLLTYLCSALGTPTFNEKILLPEDTPENADARNELLLRYGLDSAHSSAVYFEYTDPSDKQLKSHTILLGSRSLAGGGFYFMVDKRDVIYFTSSNAFEYAMRGFEDFVSGRLVAEGLEYDYNFEPSLTTDFKQWVNTEHKKEGEVVLKDSAVIATGSVAMPLMSGSDYAPNADGYAVSAGSFNFDPKKLSSHIDYSRFFAMLVGKTVGKYDTPLYVTILDEYGSSSGGLVSFGDAESVTYKYEITAIEAVITATDEIRDSSLLSGENGEGVQYNLVKVTYDYYVGGEKKNEYPAHAVIDLSSAAVSDSVEEKIRAAGIGVLDAPIELEIDYTRDNAVASTESLYIDAVMAIFSKEGDVLQKVESDSYITVAYYEIINGKKTETRTVSIDLAGNDESERWASLKEKLVGKGIGGDLDIKLYTNTYYYEIMRGFTEYRLDEITEFITSRLVVAFRYINKTEQDPFYGESVYENTMDEHKGYEKYTIYGIDASVCQSISNLLGGTGDRSDTSSSAGYVGETVAIGLTPENMEKYGLYAYTIYFELPRGIYDPADFDADVENNTEDGLSELSTYAWISTLGFTLYISEEEDGYRYVGSDMYDLVARVPAEDFSFLDYDFEELWARNNFLFLDINNVKQIEFDFSMEDYHGTYNFDVEKTQYYVGVAEDGKMIASLTEFDGSVPKIRLSVNIKSSGNTNDTAYERIKQQLGRDALSVSDIYNVLYNNGEEYMYSGLDTHGVVNYKGLFERMYRTSYQDFVLSDEEIASALSRERLMRIKVKVFEADGTSRAGYYAYDFYYLDGNRVMISAFRMDDKGNTVSERVSSFTFSNYAFENIVLSVYGVLNGEYLDDYDGYIDKK
ncbi:MAG: hypothetical protein IJF05_03680 [Clostridia bacterium]|nr:hypothetical protein [Clostridia bacterium]